MYQRQQTPLMPSPDLGAPSSSARRGSKKQTDFELSFAPSEDAMGLDAVELVLAVEEAFSISISDAEAEAARTPRDLIEIVLSKVNLADDNTCVTQRAFHKVRRDLMQLYGVNRRQVMPTASLDSLVPGKGRRKHWLRMKELAGNPRRWIRLKRPAWMTSFLTAFGLAVGIAAYVYAGRATGYPLIVAVAVTTLFGWTAALSTRPFCTEFSYPYTTVGDLATFMVGATPLAETNSGAAWTRDAVAAAVKQIVIEQLQISNYREDADFVRDLGLS